MPFLPIDPHSVSELREQAIFSSRSSSLVSHFLRTKNAPSNPSEDYQFLSDRDGITT